MTSPPGVPRANRGRGSEFLENEADVRILVQHGNHVVHGPFAEPAIVVVELNHGHVAVGIAEHDVFGGVEDRLAVFGDRRLCHDPAFGFLLDLQSLAHLFDEFRIGQQVFTNECAEFLLLCVVKLLRPAGQCGRHANKKSGHQTPAVSKSHEDCSFCLSTRSRPARRGYASSFRWLRCHWPGLPGRALGQFLQRARCKCPCFTGVAGAEIAFGHHQLGIGNVAG
jgi:hypothetical protein